LRKKKLRKKKKDFLTRFISFDKEKSEKKEKRFFDPLYFF